MSELTNIRANNVNVRWKLLATTSAFALAAYIASTDVGRAEDSMRPTVWIELGGQMEMTQGTYTRSTAPFMSLPPEPDAYNTDIFSDNQHAARSAFGLEGKLTFQPEDSDWIVSAAIRYGRTRAKHHGHEQGPQLMGYKYNNAGVIQALHPLYAAAFADAKLSYTESNSVLDFTVGRDVGIGTFGHSGSASINAGVRFAQFSTDALTHISARPTVHATRKAISALFLNGYVVFDNYMLSAEAERNFHAVGPSLSWNASTVVLGNADDGELSLDYGINAAVLFGRQQAHTSHVTTGYHAAPFCKAFKADGSCNNGWGKAGVTPIYSTGNSSDRSDSVTVPNLGGFAGVSVKYPNVKLSLGYRADFFFGAVDAGIDARQTKNLGFQGPFATVSVGLGG